MNPLFNMLMGGGNPMQQSMPNPVGQFSRAPIQKFQAIMQAMQNPAQFVRNAIPDLPAEIANDPNQILQYLKQTRGITDQQIQMLTGQMPRF